MNQTKSKPFPGSAIQMFNIPSAKASIEHYPVQFHLPVSVCMLLSFHLR
jgi:hypothetical protein